MESLYQWDREDKLYAIEALHWTDRSDRAEYLLQLIVDDDPVVRGKTALAMDGLDDSVLMEAVHALLEQGETEYEILACELLGFSRETDFSELVEPLLGSEDERVVKAAIEILDILPDESTHSLLQSSIENYLDTYSKSIRRLLNRWHPPESFDLVRELYPKVDGEFQAHLLRIALQTDHPDAPDWVDEKTSDRDIGEKKSSVLDWIR